MSLFLFALIAVLFALWVYWPRLAEWKPDMSDPFSRWVQYAADRRTIMLMDGTEATLTAVRKAPRSCKVIKQNRHYNCWIEDIACVKLEQGWVIPELWGAVDLDARPGTEVRSMKAPPSKRWLHVVPDYSRLHPSFQPRNTDTPTN